jgi:hypothetical protein
VLPDVAGFVVPRDSGTSAMAVAYGPGGVNAIRDLFFTRHQGDTNAVLRSVRVVAHAVWTNYAIVGVRRDQQALGAVPVPAATTGAVYAFRRHGAEWRVLALVRSW